VVSTIKTPKRAICIPGHTPAVPATALAIALAAFSPHPPAVSPGPRELAVRWAVRQVGVHEDGTTNCGQAVERWQRNAGWDLPPCRPWCGAFVHEAFRQGGIELRSAFLYPERVLDDARAGRRGLHTIRVRRVRRGDLVIYKWPGSGDRADHFGIVTRAYRAGSGVVHSVEGNTSQAVRAQTRPLQNVVTGVRVTP
jgi:cell wall-associated NlpC family hydrolase